MTATNIVTVEDNRAFINGTPVQMFSNDSGGFRIVALTPEGDIIKVDKCRDYNWWGYEQCRWELELYFDIEPEDLKYFPKIKDYGTWEDSSGEQHFWLIEERANLTAFTREEFDTNNDLYHQYCKIVNKYGLGDLGTIHEQIMYNCAIVNGEPFFYDFAANVKNRKYPYED